MLVVDARMVGRTVEQIAKEKHLVCLCLWPSQPSICMRWLSFYNVVLAYVV